MARSVVWDLGGHCELSLQLLYEMYRGDCGVYGYPVTPRSYITTVCEFPHTLGTLYMARWAPMHALWVLHWAFGLYRGLCEFIDSISSDGEPWELLWIIQCTMNSTQNSNIDTGHYQLLPWHPELYTGTLWSSHERRCSKQRYDFNEDAVWAPNRPSWVLIYGLWEQHRFTVRSIQVTTRSAQGYVN